MGNEIVKVNNNNSTEQTLEELKKSKRKGIGLLSLMHELYSRGLLDNAFKYFKFCAYPFRNRKEVQKYSFYNCGLIYLQRPGSVLVHTAARWKKQFNRDIKASAVPIIIMKPFGPSEIVYEYSDTENGIEPKYTINSFTSPVLPSLDKIPIEYYDKFKNLSKELGISYDEAKFGSSQAGKSVLLNTHTTYFYKKAEHKTPFIIVINQDISSVSSKIYTIIHEVAHILLGHNTVGINRSILELSTRKLPHIPYRDSLDNVICETEAETVVENVSKLIGYEYDATGYLKGYIKGSRDKVPVDHRLIIYVTDLIYSTIDKL
ncbi:MAG: hypothetical protein ACI4V7_01615 [Succinivibrionaceae bacterium]